MISKPVHGWSEITIGDWSDRCSYIDDVPFMLLKAMEESCRVNKPVAVKFDAEGWDYIIVFDQFETHIISTAPHSLKAQDSYSYHTIEIDRDELAKELITDIRRDIDDWVMWGYNYDDLAPSQLVELVKEALLVLCDVIEKRI